MRRNFQKWQQAWRKLNEDDFGGGTLAEKVDRIIELGVDLDDPESAHGFEDDLVLSLIHQYAPKKVQREIDRLHAAEFERWYA